jgi:nitroreductase
MDDRPPSCSPLASRSLRWGCPGVWSNAVVGFDLSETDRLLSTTRAVRRRLDLERAVEREVILDCLRLAVQAPTASNEQTWRWLVVTDATTRAELARLYREAGAEYLDQARRTEPDPQTARVYESAYALTDILGRVPVHVIPCIERRFDGAPNAISAAAYGSILPAVWSFQLALRARGLGSVLTTLHLVKEREAAELLGIPSDVTQVALLPVAYTVGDDFRPASRPPVETITAWDRWGTWSDAAD